MPFRFDSNVKVTTLSSLTNSDETFFLYEMYNTGFGKNGSFISNYYGYWSSKRDGFVHIGSRNRYREKYVLSGVNLKAGTVIRTPNINDSEINNYLIQRTPDDWISKFGYSIFVLLVDMHKFKYTQIKREMWFGNDSAGLNGGVAQALYEEVVDISSTMTLMKIRRLGFHDYFNPMYKFSTVFIFRNRGGHCLWQNEFLKPFSTGVWISMFIILLLISISIKVINWTEVKYLKSICSYSLVSTILITISILCQQGSPILPRYITSRFVLFVVLTLSFILYNYYTSSIVSALLNTKPKELTTFRDLIRTGLQLGIQMAPYTLVIFQRNMNEDLQTIRRLIFPEKGKPHVWNLTEGLEKVRIGGSAYHVESGYAYSVISKTFDPQAICEISDKIALIPPSMLPYWLKKDAPYRNLFKLSLRRIEEVGLVQRNRKIWEKEKPPCLSNTILLSVGLDQIFIALFLLVVGYFISCSIMFLEICYVTYVKKKQHQQ
ncbi:hypothetical protein WA026_018971 [Henosepilachna vigintioctopunctata]